ncbi:hypothetical protein CBS101457_005809 [Exobasidium rhododendri]|nr:hypothetical protein CBS101457_005809 [Exobasidium rhododendri]
MTTLSPPVIPVTDPGTSTEDTFTSSKDGLTLYLKRWQPTTASTSSSPPRAAIVFAHGFLEYYARYNNIFPLFAQSNISVVAFDQRGFGKTWTQHATPKKVHGNTTWKQQFEDLADMIRLEKSRLDQTYGKDKVPMYLMGHSMGGGIAYAFFTRQPGSEEDPPQDVKDMIKGVILSSPWIKLKKPPPGVLTWALTKVLHIFPDFPYYAAVSPKEISHDEEVQKWTAADPFFDGHIYLKCIAGPLFGGAKLIDEDRYKSWPKGKSILCAHGTADPVTSFKASKELLEKTIADDKEHRAFEGLYHECWHESGNSKIEFLNYIIDWIKAREPGAA